MSSSSSSSKLNEIMQIIYEKKSKSDPNYTRLKASLDAKRYISIIKEKRKTNDHSYFPKILHLTCKDKTMIHNETWLKCLQTYREMYADYEIKIHDNEDIYRLVQQMDPDHLNWVKKIKIGAVLADVFRYLILYLEGGVYSDLDCLPIKPIRDLIHKKHYHGNNAENHFFLYPKNKSLICKECDFYENPCDHYKWVEKKTEIDRYECLGHKYVHQYTDMILCYEFEKTWHNHMIRDHNIKGKWTDHDIGICQWFMISKPKHPFFLQCYHECIKNIKTLIELNKTNDPNYHFNVINSSGPLFFTRMLNHYMKQNETSKKKICILPSDFFCCGSFDTVPQTKNTYVKHLFTGTWLK